MKDQAPTSASLQFNIQHLPFNIQHCLLPSDSHDSGINPSPSSPSALQRNPERDDRPLPVHPLNIHGGANLARPLTHAYQTHARAPDQALAGDPPPIIAHIDEHLVVARA